MGRDKALLVPDDGGLDRRPLAARVADVLAEAGCAPVVAVGGDRRGLLAAGLDQVPDLHPGQGPLGAVRTALAALSGSSVDVVVVAACDLLHPDPTVVARLAAAAGDVDVAVPVVDGVDQWHLSAWHRRSLTHVEERFEAGERAPTRAAEGLVVVRLDGVDRAAVADADRPSDLPGPLPGSRRT